MHALATVVLLALVAAPPSRTSTLEEARIEAAASGRLVLVDVSAEWCGPCRAFREARESSRKLRQGLARHAFVVIDDQTPAGQRQQAQLRVHAFPTFILMNAEGEELERWTGFDDVKGFLHTLDRAAADRTTLEAKRARFEAAPNADLARRIALTLAARGENADAVRYHDVAMRLDPKLEKELATDRFFAVDAALASGDLSYEDLMAAGERYVAAYPGNVHVARNVGSRLADSIPEGFDRSRLRTAMERAIATYSGKLTEDDIAQRARLAAALLPPRTLDERMAELDARPSVSGTFAPIPDLKAAGRHADAARIASRMVDLDSRNAMQLSLFALGMAAEGALEGQVSVAELDAARHRALEAGGESDEVKLMAASETARGLAKGQDLELLRSQLDAGLALTEGATGDDPRASVRFELLALEAAVLEKDGAKALALEKQSLGEGWEQDPSQALDMAEFLLDCGVELPEAERLARGALAGDGDRELRVRAALATARALGAQGRSAEATAVLEAAAKATPRDARLARALASP